MPQVTQITDAERDLSVSCPQPSTRSVNPRRVDARRDHRRHQPAASLLIFRIHPLTGAAQNTE
ncbi:hypothetical protein P9209_04905 [Prescottella defluvii]|nr:hypothetical protein P9209_04905 [Prescottella defluvii]